MRLVRSSPVHHVDLVSRFCKGMYRAQVVLKYYRGFDLPQGENFNSWLKRLFEHRAFVATCSDKELYIDSYERWDRSFYVLQCIIDPEYSRYAFNRPNTSQVANAINTGRGLP